LTQCYFVGVIQKDKNLYYICYIFLKDIIFDIIEKNKYNLLQYKSATYSLLIPIFIFILLNLNAKQSDGTICNPTQFPSQINTLMSTPN